MGRGRSCVCTSVGCTGVVCVQVIVWVRVCMVVRTRPNIIKYGKPIVYVCAYVCVLGVCVYESVGTVVCVQVLCVQVLCVYMYMCVYVYVCLVVRYFLDYCVCA